MHDWQSYNAIKVTYRFMVDLHQLNVTRLIPKSLCLILSSFFLFYSQILKQGIGNTVYEV